MTAIIQESPVLVPSKFAEPSRTLGFLAEVLLSGATHVPNPGKMKIARLDLIELGFTVYRRAQLRF
jgi:hypothetical protein